jgi:hypothetical protein
MGAPDMFDQPIGIPVSKESAMIHALEAAGIAWVVINVALFVSMNREDAIQLSRDTIDRLWHAIGVL